jgi:hypothetical protein
MATNNLKQFTSSWARACHSMWAEIAALRRMETDLRAQYAMIGDARLKDVWYLGEAQHRVDDLTRVSALERIEDFVSYTVTLRAVILSSGFEIYWHEFLQSWMQQRPRFWDAVSQKRTDSGNKLYGLVRSTRGLAEQVETWITETDVGATRIQPLMPSLKAVYQVRNVLAHRAGVVDEYAAKVIALPSAQDGQILRLSVEQLLALADPVIRIARELDGKVRNEPGYRPTSR